MKSQPPAIYHDFQGIAALKHQARQDEAGSLDRVARQFESLFMQMMVKQMRQTGFGGGVFDTDRTRQYREMYDRQLALHLSESGGLGIAELLRRQLGAESAPSLQTPKRGLNAYRRDPVMPALGLLSSTSPTPPPMHAPPASKPLEQIVELQTPPLDSPEKFIDALWPAAQRAAGGIGLPPEALLAQAALETGWGVHVMPAAEGGSSHNLFGIKADSRWKGERVKRETLEYVDGVAVRRREFFRVYASYEESFQDYVGLLRNSPRYASALANTHDTSAYFAALQQAGYATDPRYAEKIVGLLQGPRMEQALSRLKSPAPLPL